MPLFKAILIDVVELSAKPIERLIVAESIKHAIKHETNLLLEDLCTDDDVKYSVRELYNKSVVSFNTEYYLVITENCPSVTDNFSNADWLFSLQEKT